MALAWVRRGELDVTNDYLRTWSDAEQIAAHWMRQWGYTDARTTTGGADGGIDVTSSAAIAQVKYHAANVGRPSLQNLYGARSHSTHLDMFFFAATGYSKTAVAYADSVGMALFTFVPSGAVRPANTVAQRFLNDVERLRRESEAARSALARQQSRVSSVKSARNSPRRGWTRNWTRLAIACWVVVVPILIMRQWTAAVVLFGAAVGLHYAAFVAAQRAYPAGITSTAPKKVPVPIADCGPSTTSAEVAPSVAIAFGDQLIHQGDHQRATEAYTLALAAPDPAVSAKAAFRLGNLHAENGALDQARAMYLQAASSGLHDVGPLACLKVADVDLLVGDRAHAVEMLTQVIALQHPEHSKEAARRLETLGRVDPSQPDALK